MSSNKIDYNKILNEAHTDFSLFKNSEDFGFPKKDSYLKKRKLSTSRNSDLFKKNKMFSFMDGEEIYLAHITTRKEDIIDSKKILCSSGCLVGSVYCVPVYKVNETEFKLHNLGKYIYQNEVKFFSDNNGNPEILLFKIKKPRDFKYCGINYLKLGKFHLNIYEELKFLLDVEERKDIDESILKMIDWSRELMHLLYKYSPKELLNNYEKFYKILQRTVKGVPIFGYFLFEITSEFIAYKQNDLESVYYSDLEEINVANFKNLVFQVVPNLTKNFDLGQFAPDINIMESRIKELGLDFEEYKLFVCESLNYYVNNYLFTGKTSPYFFSENITIEDCYKVCPHFVGHILHRIIRKMNRYPEFHANFDTFKAIKIWNYWNKNNIFFPANSIMPKGEIGINPTTPNLEYNVYETKIVKTTDEELLFSIANEATVKITPQLVELSKLIMRKKYEGKS